MKTTKIRALDPSIDSFDDELHLKDSFALPFYDLVTQFVEPPFAISIDGAWGTGKTTILMMLKELLEEEENSYPTFWFNPWEYQETEDVVLAFLQNLAAEHKDLLNDIEKSSGKIFKVLLKAGIGTALKIYTKGNVSIKNVEEDLQKIEEGQKLSFDDYENSIEAIKTDFVMLINNISKKHNNKPVIIFFDDLDRCLPDGTIRLLEALKNLFVVKDSNVIFVCGIDTHIAKQFIIKHYSGIDETFAINYFRKIFNLTISMPHSPSLEDMLKKYITELYNLPPTNKSKANLLAETIYKLGADAGITSIRKYLNVIHNFYTFENFNRRYDKDDQHIIISLLVIKEAWYPLYELLTQQALKERSKNIKEVVTSLSDLSKKQIFLFERYLTTNASFLEYPLGDLLYKYQTLT